MTRLLVAVLGFCLVSASAQATPTDITVRVLSMDAKFIGSGMDGVKVQLRDAASGKLLAEGLIQGGTGDTKRIMSEPRVRGQALSTKGSAHFTTTIDLERPTRAELTVEGPLSNPDSANRVTATQWIIPGKHLTGGDGWLLEMRGFSVHAKASIRESFVPIDRSRYAIEPRGLNEPPNLELSSNRKPAVTNNRSEMESCSWR